MPGKGVTHLTDNDFDDAVVKKVALVDFWAPWCGPCQLQGPIMDEVASVIGDKALIAKVDVDDNKNVALRFGIRNIPTILLLDDGVEKDRFVGVQQAETLISAVEGLL